MTSFARRTRWIAAAVTLALTATASLGFAAPAYAEAFPITDNFDNSRLWTTGVIPGLTSVAVASFPEAHSAPNAAYLNAFPMVPAEARVFRAITLNSGAPLPASCQATFWVRAVEIPEQNLQVHWRVHSGGPTGQIISVHGARNSQPTWVKKTFDPIAWPSNTRTITVEIAAYRGVALVDDLDVSCA